jgi:hypothetical protein
VIRFLLGVILGLASGLWLFSCLMEVACETEPDSDHVAESASAP